MDNVINVSDLPCKMRGNKKIVDWINCDRERVRFNYNDVTGVIIVSFKERTNGGVKLLVSYNNKSIEMYNSNLMKGKIGVLIGEHSKEHKYKVGQKINNVTILKQIKRKDARKNNILAYVVKCNATGKEFVQTQYNINYGYGSPYAAGKKVWEGNWLYNEKHLLPLIKNPEDAKKFSIGGNGKILCVCPNCKREKLMIARNLYNYGVSCPYCGPYLSYPEKFMMAYFESLNIRYIHQFKLGENRRFIDFFLPDKNIAVEVHGGQHYNVSAESVWRDSHKKTLDSDNFKRKYCNEQNIKLIEIDGRKSYFNFLLNSINNSSLPNISKDKEKSILQKINQRRFNNNELKILEDYKNGKSSNSISKKYNVSVKHVTNVARRHNAYINRDRNIKIRCINTGQVYDSIADASREVNISASSIGMVCNGKRKYNKAPNGEKIYWEKIKDSNYNNIVNDIV
ncbi:hypothetical protein AAG921_00625 [Staphylococcus haemolyticus]|uniref:hypothetical protein n=1 Tax=Staphylococcus haemolyticus TaxID=1283 RepID=UPI00316AB951